MTKLIRFLKDDSGATAIEYGLLAALIAVALITSVSLLGSTIATQFSTIASKIENAGT
jgi:pilus assembly protein Flp/PilA